MFINLINFRERAFTTMLGRLASWFRCSNSVGILGQNYVNKVSTPTSFSLKWYHAVSVTRSTILNSAQRVSQMPITHTQSPLFIPSCGFKQKGRVKKRCADCYFVVREERLYVLCKTHPRHKQMAMKARPEKSWILTHATQSKFRTY